MNLNFSKYSLYTFIAVLGSGYVACAMEEQDPPHTLKRTDTIEPSLLARTKRVKITRKLSEAEKQEAAANDVKLSGMVRTRSQSQSQSQKEDTNEDAVVPMQRLPSTGSQGDSQRAYNIEFDSQTIKETKERYFAALAVERSNMDALDDADTKARKRQKKSVSKVSFKEKVSVRGCPNVLEESDSQGQAVLKKTHSYHDYVARKAPAEQQRKEQKQSIDERMKSTWRDISEIQDHPIFNTKFKRSIGKINVGFRKLTSHKNDPLMAETLDDFTAWQQSYLSLTCILRALTKRFSACKDIAYAMDEVYSISTGTLNEQRDAILTAHLFDTTLHSTQNDAESDVASTVIDDDINGDTASVTSTDSLFYESMTEREYFDSLVTRYADALTTLKDDLIRLQIKPTSKTKDAGLKRTSSKS